MTTTITILGCGVVATIAWFGATALLAVIPGAYPKSDGFRTNWRRARSFSGWALVWLLLSAWQLGYLTFGGPQ